MAPAPLAVTAVSPGHGLASGGGTVTITGTGLAGTSAVMFGTTPVTGVTVINALTVTGAIPAHAAGTVDVTVTTPAGTSPVGSADQYTYGPAAPTLTWAAPAPITFGTALTSTQLDATASVPGRFSYSPRPAPSCSPAARR